MPGANCAIFNCGVCRTPEYIGISIIKVPTAVDETTKKWRSEILNVITRDRVVDANLRKQIEEDRVYICEQHFHQEELYQYNNRKTLKEGVIPHLLLPKKSITTKTPTAARRSSDHIAKREHATAADLSIQTKSCYKDFAEFIKRIRTLKLDVIIKELPNACLITKNGGEYAIPKFEINVDKDLTFFIRVFCWLLPKNNHIIESCKGSMKNVTLTVLIKEIENSILCPGLDLTVLTQEGSKSDVKMHMVPKIPSTFTEHSQPLLQDEFMRAIGCHILLDETSPVPCSECKTKFQYEMKLLNRKQNLTNTPAKLKAPLSATNPQRIILALQENRLQCKQLQVKLQEMKNENEKSAKPISQELGADLKSLFSTCDQRKIPPFMKLFWEEQQKYLQQPLAQVRYHPMVIKFCLALAAKSTSMYCEIRLNEKEGTGILVLPSLRTLRDYRNHIRPTRGFNAQIVADLQKKTAGFSPVERYIVISFDEMKIQEDLVWDKNTGELIGFVDLGDTEVNYGTLAKAQELASHVLVFLVKSIVNPLSYSFATFATKGASAFQLFPLFWRAVAILEGTCSLQVVATVSDGASSNRAFFRMHRGMDGEAGKGVVYRSVNIFSPDRFVYFFSDAPHLMKTARNNLAKSNCANASRLLWNNGCYLLWSHIHEIYQEDLECGLKLLPKLSNDHVSLTPYSAMRVHLAVQVLSSSMAKVLHEYGAKEAKGTSDFCEKMDMFFDCMNVRNTVEYKHKQKPFLAPFESLQDPRFVWLKDEFLKYFQNWQQSIEEREGDFTKANKQAMFLSGQTYEGLQITTYSIIEVVKYLLEAGVEYVLTERFCQDDLENYFGKQRAIGCRRDNPNLYSVGYNDNIIKSQFSVVPISGNVRSKGDKWNIISEEPLTKRKKCAKSDL